MREIQRRQIEELLDDLTTEFLRNYKPGHTRDDVANYDIYFMGSIILAGREIEKVYFIEIVAQEESDASKIFITMNDRGLNLTPSEMLKSYLLSEIKSNDRREKLNKRWKEQIDRLKKKDDDKGDEIFIRTWLRAQYAEVQLVKEKNAPLQISLFEDEHKRLNRNAATVTRKISLAARFIDLWVNTRVMNRKSLSYNTINPRFKRFATDNNLLFKPCKKFGKAEIDRRTRLVVQLVNLIWNTEEFNG